MSPFGRSAPGREQMGSPAPLDAPPPKTPAIEPERESPAAGGVTLEMLGYRGPEMQCSSCSHFDGQSVCDLDATTPVEPTGGCQAYSAGASKPNGEEMPEEAVEQEEREYA